MPMAKWVRRYVLGNNAVVNYDIRKFISTELLEIAGLFGLGEDWPGPENLGKLVTKSAGLFIWATTALKFIKQGGPYGPDEPLELLLGDTQTLATAASPWADLDSLYSQVLSRAFPLKQANEEKSLLYRTVLGAIVTVRDPISAATLAALLNIERRYNTSPSKIILLTVQNLSSVLHVPLGEDEPIQTVHPSFIDFLTNRNRCIEDRFFVGIKLHHRSLTLRCFQIIHEGLTQNICDLDPTLLNSEVEDLSDRVSRKIAGSVQYACRFWADHLIAASSDEELLDLLRTFYFKDLLHWLEALSVLGATDTAFRVMRMAKDWLTVCSVFDDLISVSLIHGYHYHI
jgi:hypothetical protein